MRLLEALADIFIRTFGITQPSVRMRRLATWFILAMLTLVVVGLLLLSALLYHLIHR